MHKSGRITAEPFFIKKNIYIFSRNLAEWVQNEPKMDYLTMSSKYIIRFKNGIEYRLMIGALFSRLLHF